MSAKKRTSLDAIFGHHDPAQPATGPEGKSGEGTKLESAARLKPGTAPRLKRPGVKQHTAYLPLAVHEQLRKLAFEENRKIHTYLLEGLDRVFAERGLPTIKNLS